MTTCPPNLAASHKWLGSNPWSVLPGADPTFEACRIVCQQMGRYIGNTVDDGARLFRPAIDDRAGEPAKIAIGPTQAARRRLDRPDTLADRVR